MKKITLPKTIFGENTSEAYKRIISAKDNEIPEGDKNIQDIPPANISDLKNWIILPGKSHGNYSYPEMLISSARVLYDANEPRFSEVAQKIGISLQNSSTDSMGREFIGNINWEQSMKLNLSLGHQNISIRMFADFLEHLRKGFTEKNYFVHDGDGHKINTNFLSSVYEDMVKVQNPYRAEWLDADFKYEGEKLFIEYNHRLDANGNLIAGRKEELSSDWLDEDKIPGINLEKWLKDANVHGLPKTNAGTGDLYYWCPDRDNNSVAGFSANSGRADLDCVRDRSGSIAGLGVRAAQQRHVAP